jgi:hypothetical protein
MKTMCWFCGSEMIWGGDHSFEDSCLEGDGVVANLSCTQCEATADFYLPMKEISDGPQEG